METNLNSFGNSLHSFINKNQPTEATNYLSQVLKEFTDTDLSSFTIDAYLLNIFNKSNGIISFLTKVLHNGNYKKAKVLCFNLLCTLTNNCLSKVQKYLPDVIEAVLPVGKSSASADEKQHSFELIALIISNGNLDANNIQLVTDLYGTLYQLLHLRFDKSATVQEQLLKAIGAIAKKFPSVINNSENLLDLLVYELNTELQKLPKIRRYLVITGCVSALSNCLENFQFSSNNRVASEITVYNSIKALADPELATRRVAFRESLQFLTKHASLFSNQLYSEATWWHEVLIKWFTLGADDKKVAKKCLTNFYTEIVNILRTRNEDYDRDLFKYFLHYFETVLFVEMPEKSMDSYKMESDIFGLGIFAQSFKLHTSAFQIDRIFIKVSQIIENSYILNKDTTNDNIYFLPHFVQTLSFIICNQPNLNNSHILSLQHVCVVLIKVLPNLSPTQHYLVVDAFVLAMCQMKRCLSNFEIFLNGVIYQGVLWTCSHKNALEAEIFKDAEMITYKAYMNFWKGIVNMKDFSKYEKYDIDEDTLRNVVKNIFNELIKTLFLLINRLNLNTKLKDEHATLTSIKVSYEAVQKNDFVIFVNAVDFYQDILQEIDYKLFKPFIVTYINQILSKSTKYPFVSGFYKLLVCGLKICDHLNCFKTETLLREDFKICAYSLCKFLQHIVWKIKEFKGDLQLACIYVILASPIPLVKEILPSCASVFIILFDIGHSYLKLADLGIGTLEKWFKSLPQEEIEPLLKTVLPSLDTYLRSKSIGTSASSFATTKIRKTRQAIAKRKILVQAEPELFQLQVKILTFLGQLNSNLSLSLLKWENDNETAVLNQTSFLKIQLPFKDFRIPIYLDQFVPRIVELALYSSNRKIRVFACELLHSVVIVNLGIVHPKHRADLEDLEGFLKTVIKPILKLGCDVDQVIQQLFSLLSIQLMHYYSHPYQKHNSHVQIVIDALTESVSHTTDSSLRDFAGKCIKEYVAWTIKSRNEVDLAKNPIDIKVWIRLIHSFSLHPDPFKRLGAAIIFNNTYAILREESNMFNMFWLDLLYSFVMNLSLAESCEEENICKKQVLSSLNNIMRGLVEKCDHFNTPNDLRRVPNEFVGNLLKHVAIWLLKRTGSLNPSCREKCMSMFCKIAPLVTGCNNKIEKFFEIYVSNDIEWASVTYESELLRHTTLSSVPSNKKVRSLFKWMNGLLCALDGYSFVFANKLISSEVQSHNSKFFVSMQYFLENLQTSSISNALNLISNEHVFHTSAETEKFNNIKSAIINGTIDFLTKILVNKSDVRYLTSRNFFWNQNLWNLICNRVFDPTSLGFNVEDCVEHNTIISFLNEMHNLLPTHFLMELQRTLSSYMVDKFVKVPDLNLNIVPFQQRQFLRGLSILHKCSLAKSLNILQYVKNTITYLNENLIRISGTSKVTVRLHKTVVEFYTLKLEMALENETEFSLAMNFMCDNRTLTDVEQNCEVEYGFYLFRTFKETLLKSILRNHVVFINEIFNPFKIIYLFKYLKEIEGYLEKQRDPALSQSFVNLCLTNMNKSILHFDLSAANKLDGLDLLNTLLGLTTEHLYNLIQDKPSIIQWIINLLYYEDQQSTLESRLNFQTQVLCVLPRIIGPFTAYDEKIRTALQSVNQRYFMNSDSSRMETLATFKKFFNAIKISKSVCFLLCAIDYYINYENIPKDKDIGFKLILKDFIMDTTEEQQKLLLNLIYDSSFNYNNYTNHQRYIIAKDVFPILLHHCCYGAFEEFYVTRIKSIKSVLSEEHPLENHIACRVIVNKTIAFILIENLFPRIKIENFETNMCSISKAVSSEAPSEKVLPKLFYKFSIDVCKEHHVISAPEGKEILHLYQCHAYKARAAIITSTQKDLIFYRWFFKREENKNDILWSNLIDCDKIYKFDIDIHKVPTMTKRLVNIRSNNQNDSITETVKYLESEHLFNCTLSEDVTRFDFSNALVRSQIGHYTSLNRNLNENRQFVIELEATSINEHECMPTICGLIRHIVENNITVLPNNDDDVKLPPWMEDIRVVLMAETTHVNIKIFLVTVIKNTHDIFQCYAKWFLKPILKFIVDGCAGTKINSFIIDLLEMIVSWSKVVTPADEVELASELLKFIMMISDYSLQNVFKCNLELIKLIIENWNNYLTIPYDFLFQQLQVEPASLQRAAGIQLIGVILANNIAPWHPNNMIPFLKALVKLLDNNNQKVYKPCAETIGMSLKFISQDDGMKTHISNFLVFLDKYLSKLSANKFAYCLQGICSYYPEVADKYLCQMVAKLDLIFGDFKCIYLSIFIARIEVLNSINELSSIDLKKLLSEENIQIQLFSLEFIQTSIPYLKHLYLLSILEEVLKFVKSFNADCRNAAYNVFIAIYSSYYNRKDETFVKIIKICKDALLQGLVDADLTLQEKIFEFWSSVGDIPIDVSKRVLYLLNNLYNPNIEEHFIGYNTYLIINLIKSTEEYSEKFFEYTLYDCTFEEYNLDSNWRMQHISTAPLFVDSLRSQQTDVGPMAVNVLRRTLANLEFEPTQFDNDFKPKPTQFSTYSSSLMFTVNSKTASNSDDDNFKRPSQVTSKTRYMLGKKAGTTVNPGRYFANLEIKKSIKAEEQRKERIKQRDQNVTICRKYRTGDYPDIEINLSSVLVPLQMLARDDANLARTLYTSIFASIVEKIYQDKIETDAFINGTTLGINNIFNNSTQFSPNTMAAFLEIILKHKNNMRFDPNTIVSVCQSSGLFAIGSLILEEYIVLENDREAPIKKLKGLESGKDLYWIKFAELHKEMEEWDVVNSVFMEKINCHPIALKAIHSESNSDWRLAQQYYEEVLSMSVSSQEQNDFYYESYFKCFASLSEWDKLPDHVEQVVGSNSRGDIWSALWDNDWNQQKLLPWYIKSNLRKTLTKYDETLFNLINESLQDTDKLEYLKYNFGEEIAMLWLLQNDFSSANFYLNLGITRFLENWLHLNPQFFQLRADKLLNVQSMVDIYSFINDANKINGENYKNSLDVMLKCWDQTCSSGNESLFQNETKTAYRNQFLSTLKSKCELFLDENDNRNLNTAKFHLHLNLVEKAIEEENYIVARKYIKLCPKPNGNKTLENIKWHFNLSKIPFLIAQCCDDNESKWKRLVSSVEQLNIIKQEDIFGDDNILCYSVKCSEHLCDITQEMYKILNTNNELFNKKRGDLQKLFKVMSLNSPQNLLLFGITNLKKSLHSCETQIENMMDAENLKVSACMAHAYLKLSYSVQDNEDFIGMFIVSVLRAMKLGSNEGRQLFPCILNKDIGGCYRETFDTEVKDIPTWMFLGWIPQLLANVDTPKISSLSKIITEIATAYPQAITYAYRLSKEKYKFNDDTIGELGKELVEKLNKLCSDNIIDEFLKALACVANPVSILRYYIDKLMNACNSQERFNVIIQKFLNEVYYENPKYESVTSFQGTMFKQIENYVKRIRDLSQGPFDGISFLTELRKIKETVQKLNIKESPRLIEYSPWLFNFQASNSLYDLEIPGQYTGEKRPLVNHHIKIMGFLSGVTPKLSGKRPIKLTILGNDAKEYPFLIKFGEDLRQDQRIEQVFNLMNNILSQDQQCYKRQLHIDTYQVVPLTSHLGIIEWVGNTIELKKFIGVTKAVQLEGRTKYTAWLNKDCVGNKDMNVIYDNNAYLKFGRDDTILNYKSLINSLPIDALRQAIWNVSINAEHFFTIRHKFVVSYSVMCISNWLLGIGDRHLENILMGTQNGQAIGIDFGHAFGSATQIQRIPELVPFRLTPHILHLLEPFDENGLMQKTMIHSLKAFRKKSDILLATMNVFIQEPSLDWLEYARRSLNVNNQQHNSNNDEWYPLKKLEHAKLKFEGANSINITIDELKQNRNISLFNKYVELLEGLPQHNFRSGKTNNLSVEDQVKCLLDHATDYNLLGRMYIGWEAWI